MALSLITMPPEEFRRRLPALTEAYAEDLGVCRGLPAEAARAEAARQIAESVPDGTVGDGTLLWTAHVDGVEVGWIWVTLPGPERPDMAWIHNIEVEPEYRSRGHAQAMIRAVEAQLAERGVTRLGLNVFGHNPRAMRLYEYLGFRVTAQQMAKPLTPPAPAVDVDTPADR